MKAVWSFWTKPWLSARQSFWASEKHYLLAWVLLVEEARKHYPETWLVTDDLGASMLVDGIGLPFTHVSTELKALADHDSDWWSAGKLYAYSLQTEPFIHIDSDVFLWKRLPDKLEQADLFTQIPEPLVWYHPEQIEQALKGAGGWLGGRMALVSAECPFTKRRVLRHSRWPANRFHPLLRRPSAAVNRAPVEYAWLAFCSRQAGAHDFH